MKLKLYSVENLNKNIKATAHKSGKLGFTISASARMKLDISKYVGIGYNEEDKSDKDLYILIFNAPHESGFKVYKAGAYYYLKTKLLFDSLKIDYKSESVIFDISEQNYDRENVFKLKRRERKKVNKTESA